MLFRCEDLETYIKEVNENKISVILINKSDLLSQKQRIAWIRYFEKINAKVVFWSAHDANEANEAELKLSKEPAAVKTATRRDHEVIEEEGEEHDDGDEEEEEEEDYEEDEEEEHYDTTTTEDENLAEKVEKLKTDEEKPKIEASKTETEVVVDPADVEKCKILSREELITLFKTIHKDLEKMRPGSTTIGMVG